MDARLARILGSVSILLRDLCGVTVVTGLEDDVSSLKVYGWFERDPPLPEILGKQQQQCVNRLHLLDLQQQQYDNNILFWVYKRKNIDN